LDSKKTEAVDLKTRIAKEINGLNAQDELKANDVELYVGNSEKINDKTESCQSDGVVMFRIPKITVRDS
jgi:hypothetical protein